MKINLLMFIWQLWHVEHQVNTALPQPGPDDEGVAQPSASARESRAETCCSGHPQHSGPCSVPCCRGSRQAKWPQLALVEPGHQRPNHLRLGAAPCQSPRAAASLVFVSWVLPYTPSVPGPGHSQFVPSFLFLGSYLLSSPLFPVPGAARTLVLQTPVLWWSVPGSWLGLVTVHIPVPHRYTCLAQTHWLVTLVWLPASCS